MTDVNKREVKDLVPTSKGLQAGLVEEWNDLRKGRTTPQSARAVGSIAGYLIQLKRLEMDYARFIADARTDTPDDTESGPLKAIAFG